MARSTSAAAAVAVLAAAAAAPGADAVCNMCHVQYYHKALATPEPALSTAGYCQQYAGKSCCTAATANNVHNDVLYSSDYRWDKCGKMSDACQQYFIDEACLYECDEHAGRYRKHENCSDPDGNHWQIENMPIKASFWDGWYEACKDDLFCGRGYFDMPTCTQDQCSKFSDIYEDGEDLAIAMWGGAFTYETDETNAYTMSFKVGEENPNDSVDHPAAFPNTCEGSSHDSVSFNDLQDCFDAEIKSIETLLAFHAEHSEEDHDSSSNAKSIETLLAFHAEHSDEIETLLAFHAEHSDEDHDDSSSIAIAGVALAALACVLAFIAIIRGGKKAGAAKSPNFN